MKTFKLQTIILTAILFSLLLIGANTSASVNHPGTGRLSGNHIPSDFYDPEPSIKLNRYGATQSVSPYTNATYTHQDRFDNRTILHGIDVSKWQGAIDWNQVKAAGIDYAFIQVGFRGYGASGILDETTKDPYFDINMKNAIAAGIQVGAYVFSQAITEEEAIEEAEYILDAIGDYDISMPLVMDYEYASTSSGLGGRLYGAKLSKASATNVCMAFCQEIAAAGYTPMVYANKTMLRDQLDASSLTNAGYRIWLANYTQNTDSAAAFDFWQYSEKGTVPGIKGNVDMNFYYVQQTDNFILSPNSISNADFTPVADQPFTGNAYTPEITVTHNGVTLTPNVDYTISYADNQNIGTAIITITGIGNYTNVKRIHFKILPPQVSALTLKSRSTNYIKLSWSAMTNMDGYELYRSTAINGTYEKIKTIKNLTTTSYKDNNRTAGKCYYYKLRSYITVNGNTYYSDYSPIKAVYTKASYKKTAITKTDVVLYDCIPGTKAFTYNDNSLLTALGAGTTTENKTEDTANTDSSQTTTENKTEDATNTDSSQTTTENKTEDTANTDSSQTTTENKTEDATNTDSSQTTTENKTEDATNTDSSQTTTENKTEDATNADSSQTTTENKTEDATNADSSQTTTENKTEDATNVDSSQATTEASTEVSTEITTSTQATTETITEVAAESAEPEIPTASVPLIELEKDTKLTVIYSTKNNKNKTWYYVSCKIDGITYTGFINSTKITVTKLGQVVKTKKVNVRKSASVSSKRLTTLLKNKKVTILSTKKKSGITWYKVTFKKKNKTYNGWIASPYIKVL